MIDVRDLECLTTLADERHFSRAAHRLGIAQPALSKRIQKIEADLGVELFIRDSRGVRLTPAGAVVVAHAHSMLGSWRTMKRSAEQSRSGSRGDVRIAAVGSAFYEALPRLLADARTQLPDVNLLIDEMETPAVVEALRYGEVQLGFVRPPVPYGLQMQTVWLEDLLLATPQTSELATRASVKVSEIPGDRILLFPRPSGTGYWDRVSAMFHTEGLPFAPIETAAHVSTILGMVALGAGVSIVPQSARRFSAPGVSYVTIEGTHPLPLAVATNSGLLSLAARRVLDLMPAEPLRIDTTG